jgi:hypothetical protein
MSPVGVLQYRDFITILGNVRVIPQAIEEAYGQLKTAIESLGGGRR